MELSDYGQNTVEEHTQKYHNMLKEQPLAMSLRKEHEYLAPEYIREYKYMNLMEQPVVISKTITHDGTNTTASTFGIKDALSTEIQFSNSIFHIVHKQGELPLNATAGAVFVNSPNVTLGNSQSTQQQQQQTHPIQATSPTTTLTLHDNGHDPYTHKINNFMALNGEFLTPTVCSTDTSSGVAAAETVSQFPTLSLLRETPVVVGFEDAGNVMEDDDAIMYTHCNARKVLPHKKRISRKLKAEEEKFSDATSIHKMNLNNDIEPQQEPQQLQQHHHQVVSNFVFNCEICGHGTSSQLDFFSHLKQHYEPSTNDRLIHVMDKNSETACDMVKKSVRAENVHDEEEEVFPDVNLDFGDFQHVTTPVSHNDALNQQHQQQHESEPVAADAQVSEEDMKILNSNSIDKCINYVTQTVSSPLKNLVVDEFSDTEDMLEGIRNVVDKVSIEDTCDAHELMDANDMRTTWFSSNNFSDIAFKSKSFVDVSLAQILVDNASNDAQEKVDAQVMGDKEEEPNLADLAVSPTMNSAEVLNLQNDNDLDLREPQLDTDLEKDINSMYQLEEHPTLVERRLTRRASIRAANNIRNLSHSEEIEDNLNDEYERQEGDEDVEDDEEEPEQEENIAFDEEFTLDKKKNLVDKIQVHEGEGKVVKGDKRKISKKHKKQYICTKCNREFNSGNALKYHKRTHLNLRPHRCNICERNFYAISALKSHLLIHANDKPFECEHCHRKFRQYADMNYHIVSIHTTIKSYVCEFCGKSFSRKYSLLLHVTIHTSVRNYKCDICGKAFRASVYLMNHKKIHTGEKPYECPNCGKRFRMSGDLRRHVAVHERTKNTPAKRHKKSVAAAGEIKADC